MCSDDRFSALCNFTESHSQLFRLFHHRFRKCKFCAAHSGLVSSQFAVQEHALCNKNTTSIGIIKYNFHLRFPFDWKNPFGYVVAVLIEFIITTYICLIMGILMSLAIEAILLLLTLAKHIQNLLHKFNKSAKSESAAYKHLTNYVDFHSVLKQLSKSLSHFLINLFTYSSHILHIKQPREFEL